ncbi:MAG: hypothetical protein ACI83O_000406 [Patescibacteria group bacterium]|jgi:hypothetical protein
MEERLAFLQRLRHGNWRSKITMRPIPSQPMPKGMKGEEPVIEPRRRSWFNLKDVFYLIIIAILLYLLFTGAFCPTDIIPVDTSIPYPPALPYPL